jgi:hypothetical protein
MRRLIKEGLYGAGTVHIDQPRSVARYNSALAVFGIPPTSLTEFHIDGIGWSLEIAREKGDKDYLSDTPANQYGILVSPNQQYLPIYRPAMSYLRKVLTLFADQYAEYIADVTTDSALALSFEDGVSRYESLLDLVAVSTVRVESTAGMLTSLVAHQRALAESLIESPQAWQDDALRKEIISHARTHGDLRARKAVIPPLEVETRSFYTTALGGVYIFRGEEYQIQHIVCEDERAVRSSDQLLPRVLTEHTLSSTAPRLLETLSERGLIACDINWYQAHPEVLAQRLQTLLSWIVSTTDEDAPLGELSTAQRRRSLARTDAELSLLYYDVERFVAHVKQGQLLGEVPEHVFEVLAHPTAGLSEHTTDILWQLICRRQKVPIDPLRFYVTDKIGFYERYKKWPDAFKEWVVPYLRKHYRPRMRQKGHTHG